MNVMNKFSNLLEYLYSPHLDVDKDQIIQKLNFWEQNDNSYQVDYINYEQLLYFESIALKNNDLELQTKIQKLKEQIINNYIIKEKLLFKMIG